MAFARRPLLETPFGICALVSLPAGLAFPMPPELHPDEAAHARELPPARRASWVGGRVALRAALEAVGADAIGPLRATPRGAPLLPSGFVGSISHKPDFAVALAARAPAGSAVTLGIDLESPAPLRQDISRHALTPAERAGLPVAGDRGRDLEILRRFAAKEAIYKALDPWVQRFMSFQEAEIVFEPGGRFEARVTLARGEGPFVVELHDASDASMILIAARAAPG